MSYVGKFIREGEIYAPPPSPSLDKYVSICNNVYTYLKVL